jgi:purine-binding chemotaxis protein CheW
LCAFSRLHRTVMVSAHDATHGPSLLLRVRGRLCALPLEHVVETMRPLPVNPVAGAPPYVAGLAIVRGAALPVIDLARLLGPAPGASTTTRFVTVRVASRVVALGVDAVVGVRTLSTASLGELPALLRDADADAIASVGTLDAELLLVLHAARLLPTEAVAGRAAGAAS